MINTLVITGHLIYFSQYGGRRKWNSCAPFDKSIPLPSTLVIAEELTTLDHMLKLTEGFHKL